MGSLCGAILWASLCDAKKSKIYENSRGKKNRFLRHFWLHGTMDGNDLYNHYQWLNKYSLWCVSRSHYSLTHSPPNTTSTSSFSMYFFFKFCYKNILRNTIHFFLFNALQLQKDLQFCFEVILIFLDSCVFLSWALMLVQIPIGIRMQRRIKKADFWTESQLTSYKRVKKVVDPLHPRICKCCHLPDRLHL